MVRNRWIRRSALLACGMLLAAACGGDDSDDAASEASTTTAAAGGAASTAAAGSAAFDALVERAKDEGQVIFYSAESAEVLKAYTEGFKDAYGIDVVLQTLTQGPMQERLAQEFSTGRVQADVGGNTLDSAWNAKAAADGHLAKLTEEELPNLKTLPDEHQGEFFVVNRLNPMGLFYNTDLLDESKIPAQTIDLPGALAEFKGRIAFLTPTLGGALHEWHYHLLQTVGEERYEAFIQSLVGDLDATVSSAVAATVGQVASGEVVALVAAGASTTVPTINAGAPVKLAWLEPVTVYRSSLQAMANGPHPNAAKLFINWLISEDGAKAACSNGVCAPPHLQIEGQIDIPESADFVDGVAARKTGDEYINDVVAKAAG